MTQPSVLLAVAISPMLGMGEIGTFFICYASTVRRGSATGRTAGVFPDGWSPT